MRHGWIPDRPDFRDMLYSTRVQHVALATSSDLSVKFPIKIWDQGDEGSCTGHGVGFSISFAQAMKYGPNPDQFALTRVHYTIALIRGYGWFAEPETE